MTADQLAWELAARKAVKLVMPSEMGLAVLSVEKMAMSSDDLGAN
jgi:hypothetical protein